MGESTPAQVAEFGQRFRCGLPLDHSPDDVGSKFRFQPNFGNAFSVTVKRRPYSFTPALSRIFHNETHSLGPR